MCSMLFFFCIKFPESNRFIFLPPAGKIGESFATPQRARQRKRARARRASVNNKRVRVKVCLPNTCFGLRRVVVDGGRLHRRKKVGTGIRTALQSARAGERYATQPRSKHDSRGKLRLSPSSRAKGKFVQNYSMRKRCAAAAAAVCVRLRTCGVVQGTVVSISEHLTGLSVAAFVSFVSLFINRVRWKGAFVRVSLPG